MKHILKILLFLSVSLAALVPLYAQWQRIGWQGGQFQIGAQLGNSLYYAANNFVYRSRDWGKTWTIFTKGLPVNTNFYDNARFEVQGKYLYFINSEYKAGNDNQQGIFYCSELDSSWSSKKTSLILDAYPQILFWSSDTVFAYRQLIFSWIDHDDGFYLSVDGGISWSLRSPPPTLDKFIFTFSSGSHFFYDSNYSRALYRTDNFGVNWKKLKLPAGDSVPFNLLFPSDSDAFMQLLRNPDDTLPSFYHSTDYGDTWRTSQIALPTALNVNAVNSCTAVGEQMFLSLGTDIDNLFYVSLDRGDHWSLSQLPDTFADVSGVFGTDKNYILSTSDGIFTSDSSLTTFTPLVSTGVISNQRNLICVSGTKLFALPNTSPNGIIFYDSLLVSNDNGMTWTETQFYAQNKLNKLRWVLDGDKLYASGIQKDSFVSIFRSTDEGVTWAIAAKFSSKDMISNLFVSGDTIIIIQNLTIVITIDGGLSWVAEPNAASGTITYKYGIFLKTIFSGYGGDAFVSYSTDFGITWEEEDIANIFLYSNYGSYIYGDHWLAAFSDAQNDFGLYYRTAQDQVWNQSNGLSSGLLCIPSCDEKGILYASGSGAGGNPSSLGYTALYYSLDSGANWKQWGDYVTNSPDVFIGSDYIFLAGPNELWRGPKPTIPLSVASTKSISSISLNDCYPNPAVSEMRISYSIPKRSDVVLSVFDITGKEIATIATEAHDAGSYENQWNVKSLPNGSYILKLTACGESVTKVVEVIK